MAWATKFRFGRPKLKSGGQCDHQRNWGWQPEILDKFPSERGRYLTFNIITGLQKRTLNLKTLIKSLKEYSFLLFLPCIFGYQFFFYFGHQIFGAGGQLVTNIKIPLKNTFLNVLCKYTNGRNIAIYNLYIYVYFNFFYILYYLYLTYYFSLVYHSLAFIRSISTWVQIFNFFF